MVFFCARGVGWPGWAGDNYFYFLQVMVILVQSGASPHLLLLSPLLHFPCCAGLFIGVTLLPHFKILIKKKERKKDIPNIQSVSAKVWGRGTWFRGSCPGKKSPRGWALPCPAPSYRASLMFPQTFTAAPLVRSCQGSIARRMLSALPETTHRPW